MNDQFKKATTSGRGNLASRDDLYFSDDPLDRDAYYNGEEGFDFFDKDQTLPDIATSINVRLQQQGRGKTPEELQQQYIQQQQMQNQM